MRILHALDEQLAGKLSIHRTTSSEEPYVSIEVEDNASHASAFYARIDLTQFAAALMGLSYQPCTYQLNRVLPGLRRENETREVLFPGKFPSVTTPETRRAYIRGVLAQEEHDGWLARDGDADNLNNRVRLIGKTVVDGQVYRIIFERWLDSEDRPVDFAKQHVLTLAKLDELLSVERTEQTHASDALAHTISQVRCELLQQLIGMLNSSGEPVSA